MYPNFNCSQTQKDYTPTPGSRCVWLLYIAHMLLVTITAFPVFHSIFR